MVESFRCRDLEIRSMKFCYVDESGCPGQLPLILPSAVQPALAIVGLSVGHDSVRLLTQRFVLLKQRYQFGSKRPDALQEDMPVEIKGSELRMAIRSQGSAAMDAHKFLDSLLQLLIDHEVRLFGQVLIKLPGVSFDGADVYSSALMAISRSFHLQLELENTDGQVIADFREPKLNTKVTQPICAAMLRKHGDCFPRFLECPTFAMSNSHAGLQIADILTSALIYPIALNTFGSDLPPGPHRHSSDASLRRRYIRRLKQLGTVTLPQGATISGLNVVRADQVNVGIPFFSSPSASRNNCPKKRLRPIVGVPSSRSDNNMLFLNNRSASDHLQRRVLAT